MTFKDKVLDIVKSIPEGRVMTYSQVALKAGSKNASRAVGNIMAANQDKNVPCHRVIRSDGTVGAYNHLRGKSKERLLSEEGLKFGDNGRVIL